MLLARRRAIKFAVSQHCFSQHMPFRQALVRLGGFEQWKCFRDRDFELRGLDGGIKSPESLTPATPL